jgi:starch phosphorylase
MSPSKSLMTESPEVLDSFENEIVRHLKYTLGCNDSEVDPEYLYRAMAVAVRDRLMTHWHETQRRMADSGQKKVYYLSLEFLIGRSLSNAVANLDLEETVRTALHDLGMQLEEVADKELDAGLGNGGLGRLAACFLDSCANLKLPVTGYGLRYEYGMFRQVIEDGRQIEHPDHWLLNGNPWEVERAEDSRRVHFYGHTEHYHDREGRPRVRWSNSHDVLAVPFDVPIPGHQNGTVNTLRLWRSRATDEFDLAEFNAGSYTDAVAAKNDAEQITMVLYPNDSSENGKELRLKQQYFLVSASLQDVLHKWVQQHGTDFTSFAKGNCFQLNDTHPACAVPELMRLLMDEYQLEWDAAWKITTQCMAYTNHTLLPEALERWSVGLFSSLLPRLLEIIHEINDRFLQEVSKTVSDDPALLRRLSLIEEGEHPHVRMAYLAIVGSFSINGVAGLHSKLLKAGLFNDFNQLWPERFNNKTNGVTQRRWLAYCNPALSKLVNDAIGNEWVSDLESIAKLKPFAEDKAFRDKWHAAKLQNKRKLKEHVERETGITMMESALFDVQVKRIHEYKRQLLNVLHVIHLYDRILRGDTDGMVPRCVLIGGKAAPGYFVAKLIVKLINNVAKVVNADPKANELLKLVFLPNYRVSTMEIICPATELSEQISTAGKEASGTGNMKFMMNGALTIGTLDGANIEIREQVGEDHFFLFGLDANGVVRTRENYDPNAIIAGDDDIERIMRLLEGGRFSQSEPGIFSMLTEGLRSPYDPWLSIADLRSFIDAQQEVNEAYKDQDEWTRKSILNTASSGWFSSDRTIQQYADDIWKVEPLQ